MIDVSQWQGRIDWKKVADYGIRHAYIKLLENNVEDPYVRANLEGARANGVTVGVYFFAHPSESPTRAAQRFLRETHSATAIFPGDLPPALDLEVTEGHTWQYLNDWKAQWFAAVDHHYGCRSVFYSYYYFWKMMHLYPDRPVWGAALGTKFVAPPSWTIHQYSFTGSVPGIHGHVDLSTILSDVPLVK